jgi:DNA-binding NarL/FixJ family response regulator
MQSIIEDYVLRLMLVDDSEAFRNIVIRFLKRCPGLEVVGTAAGADEALNAVSQLKPHVILLDLEMPRKSGLEIITELKEDQPNCKIIVLSLMESTSYRRIALNNGADEFVSKDQMVMTLIPAIYKVALKDRSGSRQPQIAYHG